jgi:uncharacterized membrane-anchored protein
MNKPVTLALFVLMALVQLAAPGSMIFSHERVLAKGEAFKFRTAPVDPYDAFRGRYVALRFENAKAHAAEDEPVGYGRTVYATIEVGPDGFAKFGAATASPPKSGPYLKTKAQYRDANGEVGLALPFDRFYMEETKAPAAEDAYRAANRGAERDAYAVVRVLDGGAAIEELYVGGKPIREAVEGTGK